MSAVSGMPLNCPGCGLFWADERIEQAAGVPELLSDGYARFCTVCFATWIDPNFSYTKLRGQRNEIGGRFCQWLRKPRFYSKKTDKVHKSPFQWGVAEDGLYTLSLLGIINGPLPKLRLLLVVQQHDDMRVKLHLIRRPW